MNYILFKLILVLLIASLCFGCGSKKNKKDSALESQESALRKTLEGSAKANPNNTLLTPSPPSVKEPNVALNTNNTGSKVTFVFDALNELAAGYQEFNLGLYNIDLVYDDDTIESVYKDFAISDVEFINTVPLKLAQTPKGYLNVLDVFSVPSGNIKAIRLTFSGTISYINFLAFDPDYIYNNIDNYFSNYQNLEEFYRLLPYQVELSKAFTFEEGADHVVKITINQNMSASLERFYHQNQYPIQRYIQFTPFFTAEEISETTLDVFAFGQSILGKSDAFYQIEEKQLTITNLRETITETFDEEGSLESAKFYYVQGKLDVKNHTLTAEKFIISEHKDAVNAAQEVDLEQPDMNVFPNITQLYIPFSVLDSLNLNQLMAADDEYYMINIDQEDMNIMCGQHIHFNLDTIIPEDCDNKKIKGIKFTKADTPGKFFIHSVQQFSEQIIEDQNILMYEPSEIRQYGNSAEFYTALTTTQSPLLYKLQAGGKLVGEYFEVSDTMYVQLSTENTHDNPIEELMTGSALVKTGLNAGAVTGIALAGSSGFGILGGLTYFIVSRKASQQNQSSDNNSSKPTVEKLAKGIIKNVVKDNGSGRLAFTGLSDENGELGTPKSYAWSDSSQDSDAESFVLDSDLESIRSGSTLSSTDSTIARRNSVIDFAEGDINNRIHVNPLRMLQLATLLSLIKLPPETPEDKLIEALDLAGSDKLPKAPLDKLEQKIAVKRAELEKSRSVAALTLIDDKRTVGLTPEFEAFLAIKKLDMVLEAEDRNTRIRDWVELVPDQLDNSDLIDDLKSTDENRDESEATRQAEEVKLRQVASTSKNVNEVLESPEAQKLKEIAIVGAMAKLTNDENYGAFVEKSTYLQHKFDEIMGKDKVRISPSLQIQSMETGKFIGKNDIESFTDQFVNDWKDRINDAADRGSAQDANKLTQALQAISEQNVFMSDPGSYFPVAAKIKEKVKLVLDDIVSSNGEDTFGREVETFLFPDDEVFNSDTELAAELNVRKARLEETNLRYATSEDDIRAFQANKILMESTARALVPNGDEKYIRVRFKKP